MTALLEARGLEKHFRLSKKSLFAPTLRLHAVDGVDLRIRAGEAVGLVGESGCGKSTLARLVCRLLDPSAGKLFFDGTEISNMKAGRFARSPYRRAIQMVFQDPTESLNPRFSVFDLIADPIRQLVPARNRAELRERVHEAATEVNLPLPLLDRFPHQLSVGQKARVGIARAIAVQPKLLVLDEPTSALDVSVQATVLQLLDRLRRERGIALLFVSHDLDVVRLLCDQVLVMYLGQIVESGPASEIYASPAHPYTQALLSAIPTLRDRKTERLRLDGEPQSPVNPLPDRCRLVGRCPVEQPICSTLAPALRELSEKHRSRCHFATKTPQPEREAAAVEAE